MVGIIIPTFGQFRYAQRAVLSAFASLQNHRVRVVVVDDASPDFGKSEEFEALNKSCRAYEGQGRLHYLRFTKNRGLTAAWNAGLEKAFDLGCDHVVVTNSDVVFAGHWYATLSRALHFCALVGPVTNAPGTEQRQDVSRWLPEYCLSDRAEDIERTAEQLELHYGAMVEPGPINGFFMMAKAETWQNNRYAPNQCFEPRNDFNSKGQRNPTPLMTLQEYSLQRRWAEKGLRSGFALGAFVFHYRAVTRGDKYKRGGWLRMQ